MTGRDEYESWIDPATLAELTDEYAVTMAVEPNGTAWPWIVRAACCALHDAQREHGSTIAATHENAAPLPRFWKERIAAAPLPWCTYPAGCRVETRWPGYRCALHVDDGPIVDVDGWPDETEATP